MIRKFIYFSIIFFSVEYIIAQEIKYGYHDKQGRAKSFQKINDQNLENNNIDSNFSEYIDSKFSSSFIADDTIKISVLLPFYVARNDTLVKYWLSNDEDTNQIYKKSVISIDFIDGIIMAVDSLKSLGFNIQLFVFDTENNSDTVKQILKNKKFKSSDIVFGPLFSANFKLVRNFFRGDNDKILINPLSKNYDLLSKNTYFLTPTFKQSLDSLFISLKSYEFRDNLYIISFADEKFNNIYYSFEKKLSNIYSNIQNIKYDNLQQIDKKSFRFLKDTHNVIFILSENKSFVKKVVSFCGASDSTISLFGTEIISKIPELNIHTLMRLNTHIPVSNFFDSSDSLNVNFLESFEDKFYKKINNHSLMSFRSIMYFCKPDSELLDFRNMIPNRKGHINTDIQIRKYKDFRLFSLD
ncbi:MAG: hypothetical protein CMP51_06385 [Flavobacteriales bacterium]|nr:hypothetical protein [Flavobacteriales bacterium]